jgi:hypothetical protein
LAAKGANGHHGNGHDAGHPDTGPKIGEQSEPISPLV